MTPVDLLLLAPRPSPASRGAWQRRLEALTRAARIATAEERERIDAERLAMWAASAEYRHHQATKGSENEQADAVSMLSCEMRAPEVRGLTIEECQRRKVCFLDGKPLPPRRRRWCSDECVATWFDNHVWGSASFTASKRDGRCVTCGSTRNPEINHRVPLVGRGYHEGCHHHLDGLERLCHPCHVVETTRQRRERMPVRAARPPKPTSEQLWEAMS